MEKKCTECNENITDKVSEYSLNRYKKELCYPCQETEKSKPKDKETTEEIIGGPTNRNNLDINKDFIVNIQGKEFITANGLLEMAKKDGGIQSIKILEHFYEDGAAWAIVQVEMKDGRIFTDCGSGTVDNLKPAMQKYPFEMAVTRARSRAIRFGLNVDYCSVEEL